MIWWLVDNANIIYLLLGFLALALVVSWWMSRKTKYLLALIPVCMLVLAVVLLTLFVTTDRRRLIQTVDEMARHLHERKVDRFMQHVSDSFQHATWNKSSFREYVQQQLQRYNVREFSVNKFDFGDVSRATRKGQIDFWIHAEGNWPGTLPPLRCEAEFMFESEKWRLKGFKLILGNTGQPLHLPQGRW